MHILLKKTDKYKGILVVKHSERDRLYHFLQSIKHLYNIIVHCGSMNPPTFPNFLSYNLIPKSRCINNQCIPITSSELLSKHFNNNTDYKEVNGNIRKLLKLNDIDYNIEDKNKNFDFICCNRAVPIKKTYDLLEYILNFCKDTPYRVCFIIIEQKGDKYKNYYERVLKLWEENKNPNICLIDTFNIKSDNTIYKGFTTEELSNFYKSSKIYMHCCEAEGGCRTINEAICCGCKILAKENMKGGSLSYVNKNNGSLYMPNNYKEKMHDILVSYGAYEYDEDIFKLLNESHTVEKLLTTLFNELGYSKILEYDTFKSQCNIDNLEYSFPAHNLSVPWYVKGELVSDIKTQEQLTIFQIYI
jgi:hypothetical protein